MKTALKSLEKFIEVLDQLDIWFQLDDSYQRVYIFAQDSELNKQIKDLQLCFGWFDFELFTWPSHKESFSIIDHIKFLKELPKHTVKPWRWMSDGRRKDIWAALLILMKNPAMEYKLDIAIQSKLNQLIAKLINEIAIPQYGINSDNFSKYQNDFIDYYQTKRDKIKEEQKQYKKNTEIYKKLQEEYTDYQNIIDLIV